MTDAVAVVHLETWTGPWADDDPDANFKHDIALYGHVDPLRTITTLAESIDVPVGAVCRYVLAKWASAGSEALMTLGPTALTRLGDAIAEAEADGSDEAKLACYEALKAQLAWLRVPLDDPDVYP